LLWKDTNGSAASLYETTPRPKACTITDAS